MTASKAAHAPPLQGSRSRLSQLVGSGPTRSQTIFGWIWLTPILLYFAYFSYYPIFSALSMSFHRWSLTIPERPFIGLGNYVWVFNDPTFWISLTNTLYFAAVYVAACLVLGLVLGTLIFSFREPFKSIMQTVVFLPVMTSMVVAAQVWDLMYMPGYGILNYLLGFVGLGPYMWLQSPQTVMPAIIILSVWKGLGYFVVLFIAGLTTIPYHLYEAASIDGASPFQAFWRISLPLLTPTTLFCLVTGSIGAFQVFTQVYATTRGGPGKASHVLLLYLYDHGFRFFEMGRASAIAFILFGLVLIVTLIQLRLLRSQFQY
ncbi:MAG: sugar ABC transporter permease [Chloroflexi bacterium]|nr:sugar ABC transporter permease [Chloroflexota bacterium]